jgi:hypothetical protein
VLLSARSQAPGFGATLSELYRIYRYPLYAYVRRRGHASEEAWALTLIHRLRKRYTASMREEIGRTVVNPAEIDAEIHELCQALVVAQGWILP